MTFPMPALSRVFPRRRAVCAAGFSLVEMLVVIAIVGSLAAVGAPMMSSLIVNTRLNDAAARMKSATTRLQMVLADNYNTANRNDTLPRIPGAMYSGVALVVRWDDAASECEIFWANHNQAAKDTSGAALAAQTPSQVGYSRVATLEPLSLGTGIRVTGVYRDDSKAGRLTIIPDHFVITLDANGLATPFSKTVYVNLQQAPANDATLPDPKPWRQWNTASNYAGGDAASLSTGEGFATSLPMVVIYREDDIPLGGNAPSGVAWRTADGKLNPALEPNDIIRTARARVMTFPLQGGAPLDF